MLATRERECIFIPLKIAKRKLYKNAVDGVVIAVIQVVEDPIQASNGRCLRVIPFLGLAVVHHPGDLGAAWSTWSTTDMHLKWTVRGEADSWVHGCTQGNASLLRTK